MKLIKLFFLFTGFIFITNLAQSVTYNINEIYQQLGIKTTLSYTAEMHISYTESSPNSSIFKFFYKNGDVRIEGGNEKNKIIAILKKDGTTHSYNADTKKWDTKQFQDIVANQASPKFVKTGTELLNEKNCTKYETNNISGYKSIIWIHEGIIQKKVSFSDDNNSEVVVYKKIEIKPLEDYLFLPKTTAKNKPHN